MPLTASEAESQSNAASLAAADLESHHSESQAGDTGSGGGSDGGSGSGGSGGGSATLLVWLKRRGLEQYEPALRALGVETVSDLSLATDIDLHREAGLDQAAIDVLRGRRQEPEARQLFSCTDDAFKGGWLGQLKSIQ